MSLACEAAPHGLVGRSPQIVQIGQAISKLGQTRSPVLLLGETGVGKEIIAKAIFDANPVGNCVPIDCGSLVGPLMESELFGHTKGAFTGATDAKRGLIELANGGTAFFDEIGDLPLELQVKLLRVLQEREYRPVGSLVRHKVDIRVIAATHRDLAKEVSRGGFRQDLYYRLNVITLRIPPLRDRREDIQPLIDYFLSKQEDGFSLTQEAKQVMMDYDWPGNVRELANCIARMTAMATGPLLHTSELPSNLQNFLAARTAEQRFMAASASASLPAVATEAFAAGRGLAPASSFEPLTAPAAGVLPLAEVEKRAILEALDHTRGDRSMAANLLGIGRTTLYRKLKEYQVGTVLD